MSQTMTDTTSFKNFNIDYRIQKAIEKLGWITPTDIQNEALALSLNGEHLLIRSRTGSGKTAIYLISLVHQLLNKGNKDSKAIIFSPSNELCAQISQFLQKILRYVKSIKFVNLSDNNNSNNDFTDFHIFIGTPTKSLSFLENFSKNDAFKFVVFDEADLLFTFGHRKALDSISSLISHRLQVLILSATLNEDVEKLCVVNLVNPKRVIASNEPFPDSCQLSQYLIKCVPEDRCLILYSMFSLSLINGKTLIFTINTNVSYKLLLFLKKFGLSAAVLNSELPVNTRRRVIEKFSSGKVKILITTDIEENKDSEFSLSRGMDFSAVENVVNFDFPGSVATYIHRVGRTARVDSVGLAFTFYSNEDENLESLRIFVDKNSNSKLMPFKFKVDLVEGLRYRVEDALRSLTKTTIYNARRAEIKDEMLNSKKVQDHFKNKPDDKMVFKSSKFKRKVQNVDHLKRIPDYLIPEHLRGTINTRTDNKTDFTVNRRKAFMKKKFGRKNKKVDPLTLSKSKRTIEQI